MIEEHTTIRLPSSLYDLIEQKVADLYEELGISSAPINPFDIANQRGYLLKPFSSFKLADRLFFSSKDMDATNYFDPGLCTFVICYDDKQIDERIRFTLMHEIGHIDMGHREESELARKVADYYAAYALAPSPIIAMMNCEDYLDVAKIFNVSQYCADICFQRFINWERVTNQLKPHEERLVKLFQK